MPPADDCRRADPRPAAGDRGGRRRPRQRRPSTRSFSARWCNTRRRTGRFTITRRSWKDVHAAGALAVVAADPLALCLLRPPGEFGADVAVGTHAAFRRAAGLRRAARGVLRHAGRIQAPHARPARRRVEGCPRQARLPPGAANARAAHPPRQGDEQHLHGAGAPGGHRLDVRRLPRAGGTARNRAARPPSDRPAGGGAAAARLPASEPEPFFDTVTVHVGAERAAAIHAGGAGQAASTCGTSTTATVGISLDETVDLVDLQDLWQVFHGGDALGFEPAALRGGDRRPTRRIPRPVRAHERFPDAPGLQPLPHGDGDAALPARAWKARTSR